MANNHTNDIRRLRHSKTMFTIITVLLLIIAALVAILLISKNNGSIRNKSDSGVLIDSKTNELTMYSMEILSIDDIQNDRILDWVTESTTKQGDYTQYFTLNNISSADFDLYIYLPKAQEVFGDISMDNIKVTESGTALKIIIDTDNQIKHTKASTQLILHVYSNMPGQQTDIISEILVVNDTIYFCAVASSKSLG